MNFNMKKILAIAFVVIGLLSVILGLSAYGLDTGYYESSSAYGGDAYTGIQNAAAQTANNVRYVTEAVASVGGSILLVTGLVLILVGVKAFMEEMGDLADKKLFGAATYSAAPVAPAEPEETIVCPNCGSSQAKDAGFCGSCGTKLN